MSETSARCGPEANGTPVQKKSLTEQRYSFSVRPMRKFSLTSMFGLGDLAPERRRALSLVYATSMALVMGVNFIQPALPAMAKPFGIPDAALGLVMTMLTAPAIFLAALFWMPETKGERRSGTRAYLGDILRLTRHPRLLVAFSAGFLRFFLDYGFLTYFPLFLVRTHGISTATAGLLYTFFSAGAMITSSQAGRLAAGRDKAHLLLVAFLISGAAVIAVPLIPGVWLVGSALFFYGLANGVISPMQKSLLTQNAPAELRGGIVSFDRLIQQISKTTSTSIVGLLLVSAELSTIFWLLGILSIVSVALMACLLPRSQRVVSSASAT